MNIHHYPRAVLYTRELEPITVIDVSAWLWEMLVQQGRARLPVYEKLTQHPAPHLFRIVDIHAELFRYRDAATLMLFVDDEELALALRSSFLPGQQAAVKEVRGRARVEGFMKALVALRGEG